MIKADPLRQMWRSANLLLTLAGISAVGIPLIVITWIANNGAGLAAATTTGLLSFLALGGAAAYMLRNVAFGLFEASKKSFGTANESIRFIHSFINDHIGQYERSLITGFAEKELASRYRIAPIVMVAEFVWIIFAIFVILLFFYVMGSSRSASCRYLR
jgi:hypothetical protein